MQTKGLFYEEILFSISCKQREATFTCVVCQNYDILLNKQVLTYVADIDLDEKPKFFFLLVNSSRQLRE